MDLASEVIELRRRLALAEETLRGRTVREAQHSFLLRLGDAVREQSTAEAKIELAARLLGEHLHASRILWAEYDWNRKVAHIFNGWFADGAQPFPTVMRLADYDGEALSTLRAGKTVRVDDVGRLTGEPGYAAIAQVGVQALLSPPLLVDGILRVNLSIHQHEPRHWTDDDVTLVQDVAERLWAEVVRARAEAALAASEKKYRSLFQTMGQGYSDLELLRDDDGRVVDYRHIALNPAFERLTGLSIAETVGRTALECLPYLEPWWLATYERIAASGEPERLEYPVASLNRWYEVFVYPRGDDQLSLLYEDITLRKEAELALGESEERYRALFESMDEAYAVVEVLKDDDGRWADFRFIEVNHAFLEHTKMPWPVGKTATELLGSPNPRWTELYGEALDTGKPLRVEEAEATLGLIFDLNIFSLDRDRNRVAVLFTNITNRAEAERAQRALRERQSFLLELSDALRPLADPTEIQATTAEMLGTHLAVDRAMYGEVTGEPGAEMGVIRGQYVRPADPDRPAPIPFPGHFAFESFGADVMARRYSGEGLVVADVEADPAFDAKERAAWAMVGVRAAIVAPLVKDGCLVAELGVHSETPRIWTDAEVSLVREAGERTWAAAERARSETALHESEERFRQFAHAAAEGAWIRDAESLDMEYVSPAAIRIYGVEPHALLGGVQQWASLILPEDRDATLAHLEDARQGGGVSHEFRIRRPSDGAFRWIKSTVFPLVDPQGRVQRIGGLDEDVTEARLAVEHQGVLLAELQHRVRNIMAMIRSMVRRSADGAADTDEYRTLLEGRLLALARVQALLTRQANAGGSLRDIIESEVSAQANGGGQYELLGPDVQLSPKAVEVLTLAFHELATNALKYGALSVPEGRLRVEWAPFERRGRTWLTIDWTEEGAPSRGPMIRRGFGSDLIEGKIPYELGGEGRINIAPGGAHCRLEFPLREGESILETDAPSPTAVFGGTLDMIGAPDLTGRSVLVAEDDYYMASDTAAALRCAGATVLGPCPSEDATLDLLETVTPTHAVLDLNLGGGGPRFAIAETLRARGVPFIFLTGYDPDAVPFDLADVVRLQKPVSLRTIVDAVEQL
ncbi:PAS domain S-box protein [uncultured Sphingomonas sp.]|uniref:PAS domain S-box protein n=1 Tax=uncultured Sphingomonas sp. TaxID=158754 RepID=UPI00261A1AB1|nr:PAS domain S-box protein [uncultured Sphingomonas sp.]